MSREGKPIPKMRNEQKKLNEYKNYVHKNLQYHSFQIHSHLIFNDGLRFECVCVCLFALGTYSSLILVETKLHWMNLKLLFSPSTCLRSFLYVHISVFVLMCGCVSVSEKDCDRYTAWRIAQYLLVHIHRGLFTFKIGNWNLNWRSNCLVRRRISKLKILERSITQKHR